MQVLFELFPLIIFVAFLVKTDVFIATGALMAAVSVQLVVNKLLSKPINKMTLIATALLFVFGGLTLLLKNEAFIKWKPTAVYWLFAAVFLGSQFIGEKTLAQRFYQAVFEQAVEGEIRFSKAMWARLNFFWVVVFVLLGLANYFAFQNLDTVSWGFFKLGMVAVYFLMVLAQFFYVYHKYTKQGEAVGNSE